MKPAQIWWCKHCSKQFRTRALMRKHIIEDHGIIGKRGGWCKGLTKDTDPRLKKTGDTYRKHLAEGKFTPSQTGKPHSAAEKKNLSQKLKKFYKEHPDLVPYKLHHSSKESYPEKYFNDLFAKENISGFERDYYVDGYYLDYAFIDKKVDFEVDGSQHYVDPKIVEHDKVRTQHLESLGWKTFRIDWRVWQKLSPSQKHEKIEELKKMI